MAVNVGNAFLSYEEFRDVVTKYEEETYVNYTAYDSTIERGRKKQPKSTFR